MRRIPASQVTCTVEVLVHGKERTTLHVQHTCQVYDTFHAGFSSFPSIRATPDTLTVPTLYVQYNCCSQVSNNSFLSLYFCMYFSLLVNAFPPPPSFSHLPYLSYQPKTSTCIIARSSPVPPPSFLASFSSIRAFEICQTLLRLTNSINRHFHPSKSLLFSFSNHTVGLMADCLSPFLKFHLYKKFMRLLLQTLQLHHCTTYHCLGTCCTLLLLSSLQSLFLITLHYFPRLTFLYNHPTPILLTPDAQISPPLSSYCAYSYFF